MGIKKIDEILDSKNDEEKNLLLLLLLSGLSSKLFAVLPAKW